LQYRLDSGKITHHTNKQRPLAVRQIASYLRGVISILAVIIHTLILGVFLFLSVLLRLITPPSLARRFANPLIVEVALIWVGGILWWMRHVHRLDVSVDHDIELSMDQWNMIIANHQSWLDIFILFFATYRRIPVMKFFIKRELIWIPIAGVAWWALDYPFMSRYSKAYLAKHPEKAGQDLITTQQACEKFSLEPTTVVNFLEGTRFTPEKHRKQQSPYRHLLKPKAGGIAFALQALGEKFNTVIDASIHYQGKAPSTWDMACGNVGKITLQMRKLDVPERFMSMDYINNESDRVTFQNWTSELWQRKDQILDKLDR